jgi:hypothetical protein
MTMWTMGRYSTNNSVAKNIGFYYMSNAAGRLVHSLTPPLPYTHIVVPGWLTTV